MQYEEIRAYIKTGDVLAFKGTWLISRAIQAWTRKPYSHVGLALWLKTDFETKERLCVLEAMEGLGVRIVPLSHALGKYWKKGGKAYWCPLLLPRGYDAVKFAQDHWDEAYVSLYQLLLAASPSLQYLRSLRTNYTDFEGWHCSELVTRSLMSIGYQHDKKPEFTTPGEVVEFSCLDKSIELEPSRQNGSQSFDDS